MGALAITILIGVALVLGFGVQYLTKPASRLDWLFVAAAASIGGFLGSELLTNTVFAGLRDGPEIDGLTLVPAAIFGLMLAFVADAMVRYAAKPMSL
jgi:hypothetical protein